MKGIILAGGLGSRLRPLTHVTNKHLIPIFDKPMIEYPIHTLKTMDIEDVLIVTGPEWCGDFMRFLGSGKKYGLKFTYKIQDEAGGIAHALALAEDYVGNDNCAVILGDNIYEDDFEDARVEFDTKSLERSLAMAFFKEVKNPTRFGVAKFNEKGDKIIDILEKPETPPSNMAQTGLYMYTPDVFDIIKKLVPSKRGELEITDVNRAYLKNENLEYSIVSNYWSDAGTFESLWKTGNHIAYKKLGK